MFSRPEIGRNKHKHYFISGLILFLSLIVGGIVYAVTIEAIIKPDMDDKLVHVLDNIALTIFCLIIIVGLLYSIRFIHRRPFRTLITDAPRIRWRLMFIGFGVLVVGIATVYPLTMLIAPQQFEYNGVDSELFLIIVLSAILAIPIQTTLEELFFRGFLLQWFGKFIKSTVLLGIVITIIFASLHFFNPEMVMSPFIVAGGYVMMSISYTVTTLILKGTEFVIGAHAANNMLLMVFFLFSENALLAPMSIWTLNYSPLVFFITIYGMNFLWLAFVLIYRERLLKPYSV